MVLYTRLMLSNLTSYQPDLPAGEMYMQLWDNAEQHMSYIIIYYTYGSLFVLYNYVMYNCMYFGEHFSHSYFMTLCNNYALSMCAVWVSTFN